MAAFCKQWMMQKQQFSGANTVQGRYGGCMTPITTLRLISPTALEARGKHYECRIGRGGVAAKGEKREGDLKTPSGEFALRCVYYRPDRMAAPKTALPVIALTPEDGWCDDPKHPLYNQFVKLVPPFVPPAPATPVACGGDGGGLVPSHERLWREDHVYDLIIPLGYNDGGDGPIITGAGSAIFMHIMHEDGVGTEGCIALKREDLLELLAEISGGGAFVQIMAPRDEAGF
jgi:L,D-peptidoglycan transpeptidase YkuD (ErfK/YbiS/YcfS/YnhG family)